MSPLHLLYCNDGNLSNTNLSVYGTCCKVGINLVALRWIFSRDCWSRAKCGPQITFPYSTIGRTIVLETQQHIVVKILKAFTDS